MRPASEPGRSWHVINDLYAELMSEFHGYLKQAGTAENSVRLYLGTARHFLAWLRVDSVELETIDDAVLLAFRDHDCCCFLSTQGVTTHPNFRHNISIGMVEHGGGVAFECDLDGCHGTVALCGHGLEIA